MKRLILSILLASAGFMAVVQAQQIFFSYDASGNRVERWMEILPGSAVTDDTVRVHQQGPMVRADDVKNATQTGYRDTLGDSRVIIYPNPTLGLVRIWLERPQPVYYRVYTPMGTTVFQGTFEEQENPVDLSAYPPGIYFLEMSHARAHNYWRIIKQ